MESIAKLKNSPHSPRKMRLLADLVRGKQVGEALDILKYHSKSMYATQMEKLIVSAMSNWENKYENDAADSQLFVKEIFVDGGKMLKRIQPAPQGRAHRIRKRSNHITVILDSAIADQLVEVEAAEQEEIENTNDNG